MHLKRTAYSDLTIDQININIIVYERMVEFYQNYLEKHGEYEYVDERINYLYSELSEYLIARDLHLEEKTHIAVLNS